MKILARAAIAAGAALLALGVPGAPAQAQTDLSGRWAGYGRAATVNPGPPNLSSFEIVARSGRRFAGVVDSGTTRAPVEGTISASGILDAVGRDAAGNLVEVHGKVCGVRPPNPNYPPNPCIVAAPTDPCRLAALRYKVTGPRMHAAGFLLLLQDSPAAAMPPGPPNIAGTWSGGFLSGKGTPGGGDLDMDVWQQDGDPAGGASPAFRGTASLSHVYSPPSPIMPNGSFFDVFFDLQGTVGLPAVQDDGSAAAAFAAIGVQSSSGQEGQGPEGLVAIFVGTWSNPGPPDDPNMPPGPRTIKGGYALFGSFFDVFFDVFNGAAATFDAGTFDLAREE